MAASNEVIPDGASHLWALIVREGGLDVSGYDSDLLSELSGNLEVSSEDFGGELDRAGISVETLVIQLLLAVAPYAAILHDVLAFFAQIGARSSSDKIQVRFDFDRAGSGFEFDLRMFREWVSEFHQAVVKVQYDAIDEFSSFEIRSAFVVYGVTYEASGPASSETEMMPSDPGVAQWLTDVRTDSARLAALPAPPASDNPELAALLARVWRFLEAAAVTAVSDPRDQLRDEDLIQTIVRGAYLLTPEPAQLLRRLKDVFSAIPTRPVDKAALTERLVEMLKLPAWKRRSELYSVWVGIRIIRALGAGVRVHVVDGTIVFSFSGTHLATVIVGRENLHVWCELRTPATGLFGKGRKGAIQPDYVVRREPTSHPNSAILVVEVKQYRRQGRRNFAHALIDYARVHKKADVVLVNYGPTTSSVLELVTSQDASLLPRTHVIGYFRPGSAQSILDFEKVVQSAAGLLSLPRDVAEGRTLPLVQKGGSRISSGLLRLTWIAEVDLDLHCWVTDAHGRRQHISYSRMTGDLGGSRVVLDRDVRVGGEPETLTYENVGSVSVDFAVHAYTEGSDVVRAQPRVEASSSGGVWIIEPPARLQGTWWRLLRIGPEASPVRIWNTIDDQAPFGDEV